MYIRFRVSKVTGIWLTIVILAIGISGIIAFLPSTSGPSSVPAKSLTQTATPLPTPSHWLLKSGPSLYIYQGGEDDGKSTVGAARKFSATVNQKSTDCVAFVFTGPVLYYFGIFDGYWVDTGIDQSEVEAKLQEAITFVKTHCDAAPVTVVKIP